MTIEAIGALIRWHWLGIPESDNRPGFDSESLELLKVLSFPVGYLVKHSNSFIRAIVGLRSVI